MTIKGRGKKNQIMLDGGMARERTASSGRLGLTRHWVCLPIGLSATACSIEVVGFV